MLSGQLFDGAVELSDTAESFRNSTLSLPAGCGVALLADQADQPILLLAGARLRGLVRRRLEEARPELKTRSTRLGPIVRRVFYVRCYSKLESHLRYLDIARAVWDRRYAELFDKRLTCHLICIESGRRYPFFRHTNSLSNDSLRYWGPFLGYKSTKRFLEAVQDIFSLCRRPERLTGALRAGACSYAQIHRCSSACDGSVSSQQYGLQIARAIEFLDGSAAVRAELLALRMKQLSTEQRYEQAQRLKDLLTAMRDGKEPFDRDVVPLERLWSLSLQPGRPRAITGKRPATTISPFIIGPGRVIQSEPFMPAEAEEACSALLDRLRPDRLERLLRCQKPDSELLAWSADFLYRNKRDNGLYFRYDDLQAISGESLAELVVGHFGKHNASDKKDQKS